jgi:hypothetical protein
MREACLGQEVGDALPAGGARDSRRMKRVAELPATERRSITGRWNTMARRAPSVSARPPQVMRPDVGANSPMASRISVLLPAPFGPTSTVGAPASTCSEMPRTRVTSRASADTPSNTSGRSLTGGRMLSPRESRRPGARPRRRR